MTTTSKRDQRDEPSAFTKAGATKATGGKATGAKATGGKATAAKARAKKAGRRGRRSSALKVSKDRNVGVIATFVAVGVIAAGLIGYAFWAQRDSAGLSWEDEAAAIPGITNFRETNPDMLTNQHVTGPQQYEVSPPVGGNHNGAWQDCQGHVYTEPIFSEHAVHSLEHGAIWITYNPNQLNADQIGQLSSLVNGNEKMLMSPYPDLDAPISLQAWGYQLKVDDPGDARINQFIRALRINASLEGPNARCDGITTTSANPESLNQGG